MNFVPARNFKFSQGPTGQFLSGLGWNPFQGKLKEDSKYIFSDLAYQKFRLNLALGTLNAIKLHSLM